MLSEFLVRGQWESRLLPKAHYTLYLNRINTKERSLYEYERLLIKSESLI